MFVLYLLFFPFAREDKKKKTTQKGAFNYNENKDDTIRQKKKKNIFSFFWDTTMKQHQKMSECALFYCCILYNIFSLFSRAITITIFRNCFTTTTTLHAFMHAISSFTISLMTSLVSNILIHIIS